MSVQLLRDAAALMRERAEDSAASWVCAEAEPEDRAWFSPADLSPTGFVGPEDAVHMAAMTPAVALMVADLLDALAHQPNWHEHDNCPDSDVKACCAAAARVLSRAYIGGAA